MTSTTQPDKTSTETITTEHKTDEGIHLSVSLVCALLMNSSYRKRCRLLMRHDTVCSAQQRVSHEQEKNEKTLQKSSNKDSKGRNEPQKRPQKALA